MISSHTYWTHADTEYEVYYTIDHGEIKDFEICPALKLSAEQERDIIELIYEDAREEESYG